ncbi:MAG: L,D-transpeptidase family protein [Alphaproteobacteria bacterium]
MNRLSGLFALAVMFFLTACDVVAPRDPNAPERFANLGTKDAVVFTTTGNIDPSQEVPQVVGRANVSQSSIDQVYGAFSKSPLWVGGKRWSNQAKLAHEALSKSWAHGLQPNSYLPKTLSRLGRWTVEKDVILTAGVIKYLSDVKFGRTRQAHSNAAAILVQALKTGTVDASLARAEPQDFFYQRMKTAALKGLSRRGAKTPNFGALEETMEQLRLKAGPKVDSGTLVIVNIAAFDLQVWDGGQQVLGSKVIVGKEGRNTPPGPDRIKNLKFSPDWNAPKSIVERDLFPKLQANPADFNKFGMEVYLRGKRVADPTTVDWSKQSASSVRMRQAPGKDNVLGGVRFTLANSNAIYLHDTANRSLYGKVERASSSGCVRVAKAKELAHWILQRDGKNWGMDKVEEAMNAGETSFVNLKRSIPVEMVYYTAWVDGNGALSLARDLYNKNAGLRAQLRVN